MLRGLALLALGLTLPAHAGDRVHWKHIESEVAAAEKAQPTCETSTATATNDHVAAVYEELQTPLTRKDDTADAFTARIRAAVLVRRVAAAGSRQAHALDACGDAQAGFVAWQLDAMAQSMDRTALEVLDHAVTALGPDPARDLCTLLPSPVAAKRPKVCTG